MLDYFIKLLQCQSGGYRESKTRAKSASQPLQPPYRWKCFAPSPKFMLRFLTYHTGKPISIKQEKRQGFFRTLPDPAKSFLSFLYGSGTCQNIILPGRGCCLILSRQLFFHPQKIGDCFRGC